MIKIKKSVKGVTLVELIAVILILGLAITSLMGVLTQVTQSAWFDDDIAKANFCAQTGMERVKSIKNFTDIINNTSICSSGLIYNITVTGAVLSGNNWVPGVNNTFKLINVTGVKHSPNNNTAVSLYTLVSNNSAGQACF